VVSLEERDQDFVAGLTIGVVMALTPQTFPSEQIAANDEACTRGEFQANSQTYRAFGADADSPPRWAMSEDSQRIVYLAIMPPPEVVRRWVRETGGRGALTFRESPQYRLASTNGETRDIHLIFAEMPGDAQLHAAFKDALEGRLPRIATFNSATGDLVLAARQPL
jgi:hypothetical protein